MAYPLRQLEAKLMKVVTVISTEVELSGRYVFRDDTGNPFMWGPHPERYEYHPAASLAEADNLSFLCPLCFAKNGGAKGTHRVMVTLADRTCPEAAGSRDATGKPSRWHASGTGIDDLVLTPSILLDASRPPECGCHWHGWVGSSGIEPGHAG